jgi:hypothetical protein
MTLYLILTIQTTHLRIRTDGTGVVTGIHSQERFTAGARFADGRGLAPDTVKSLLYAECVLVCLLSRGPLTVSLHLTSCVSSFCEPR